MGPSSLPPSAAVAAHPASAVIASTAPAAVAQVFLFIEDTPFFVERCLVVSIPECQVS
jgi:hypothetical protein